LVEPERANLADELGNLAFFAGAWLLGRMIRRREIRAEREQRRADTAERDRDEQMRRALRDERARIAGELHDLVAHGVSVMTLQAGAARHALHTDADRAREALLAIEATGRQALDEMHRLLGLLRRGDDGLASFEPPATLAGIDDLLEQVRAAGLVAEVHISGESRRLAPGLEVSAYRIVQEAITNALKHAGASRVDVHLDYTTKGLRVEVVDDGPGIRSARPGALPGAGHGIIGMRERVAMFGGELQVGPRAGHGWRVSARFPLHPP
jgi:signal transduction histidine kinase